MKVKKILVSQPEPSSEKSPYKRLKEKLKLTIDFRPFIHVEGATAKEVRRVHASGPRGPKVRSHKSGPALTGGPLRCPSCP